MPHDKCTFSIILGLRDMKKIGYDLATKVGDGVLIFKHKRQHSKPEYLQSKEEILDKLQDYGDEFGGYTLANQIKQQHQHLQQSRQKESNDDSDEKDDGRFSSHQ